MPETVTDLESGTSGLDCANVPRVLFVNDTVVGVEPAGPVADKDVDWPRQMLVDVIAAVTVGDGFTVTD
jgi:hypothetical protein